MFRAKAVENKREYVHCNVTLRRVHGTTLAVESNKYYIFLCCVRACVRASVCGGARARACAFARVVLFSMPCADAIWSVSYLTPPYFSALSHKRYDFRKNVTEHKMCVLIFSTTFI